nr:hypothetical protein [Tanacetum cinerariifolium]
MNYTLLDMVRSMMNLITLSLSFWGYALETATRILNMVPTKKVDKTTYELWIPKGNDGLLFLLPTLKQNFIARYAEFLEKKFLSQEICGRVEELEKIQDKDTSPSENTSKIPIELRDLNETNKYKAAILDLESDKWVDAINVEMQYMKDNQVWCLVDLSPNCKTVGSKWFFKKKTNMDGIIHTYKARLVAKGYTQTCGVNYEETFSLVDDIRATRILIATAAFYYYEIWKMNNPGEPYWTAVKTILKYLKNTKDMFLVYCGNPEAELRVDCYCDAGFESDRDDIKSLTGHVFYWYKN